MLDAASSSAERAQRYRELAESADQHAIKTEGEIRLGYLRLAEQWRKLATFAEETDAMGGWPLEAKAE